MPQKPYSEQEKNQVLSLKWAKSQTKAQKSSKDDFIREIWWPVGESGRSVPYPGDPRIIRREKQSQTIAIKFGLYMIRVLARGLLKVRAKGY